MTQVRYVHFGLGASCRITCRNQAPSAERLRMLPVRRDGEVESPGKLILTYSCARYRRML